MSVSTTVATAMTALPPQASKNRVPTVNRPRGDEAAPNGEVARRCHKGYGPTRSSTANMPPHGCVPYGVMSLCLPVPPPI